MQKLLNSNVSRDITSPGNGEEPSFYHINLLLKNQKKFAIASSSVMSYYYSSTFFS